jgi:hypothetical protein
MKEEAHGSTRTPPAPLAPAPDLRPVDGFVVGGEASWRDGDNLWLLLSRPGERLIDFFLEDERVEGSPDPVPCACAGLGPDGTVQIAEVDWELDRFLSEMLDEKEAGRL